MSQAAAARGPLRCDGCGQPADEDHWRLRIERLQWASRFRPLRIRLLLVCEAPPPAMEDYLYWCPTEPVGQRPQPQLVTALAMALAEGAPASSREAILTQAYRRSIFVAHVVECPTPPAVLPALLLEREPVMWDRIRFSYRPRAVLVLSRKLAALVERLRAAGIGASVLAPTAEPADIARHVHELLAKSK